MLIQPIVQTQVGVLNKQLVQNLNQDSITRFLRAEQQHLKLTRGSLVDLDPKNSRISKIEIS